MNNQQLDSLLRAAVEYEASDLHLVVGVPPAFRVNGEIILADEDVLTEGHLHAMTHSLLNELQLATFDREWELCISQRHDVGGRVRVTLYKRNGHPEMSVRFCGHVIPDRDALGLPPQIDDLARRPNGLVLIIGPTGAGKTTTMNYMVNLINEERRCKIVTIEDPIEFVHENRRAIIVRRRCSPTSAPSTAPSSMSCGRIRT